MARRCAAARSYRPLSAELRITYPQYLVRLVLWEADEPVLLKFIDSLLGLDSGTLTPLLKRLDKQGFVERWRGPDDEHRTLAALTADGASLRTRAECITEAMAEAIRRWALTLPSSRNRWTSWRACLWTWSCWPSEDDFAG